jgi:DNA polymerase-1
LACDDWLETSGVDAKMIMQVHDELVFEVAEAALDNCRDTIRQLMCNAAQLDVPLLVDIGVGSNWDEAH